MIPKQPLREIMLEVHEKRVKEIYGIPSSKEISYNKDSTQICVDKKPIFSYLDKKLMKPAFLNKLKNMRHERRSKLIKAHSESKDDAEALFNLQFDYELLALDHLISQDKVSKICLSLSCPFERELASSYLLTPSSGRTFFEEVQIKELEAVGSHLRKESGLSEEGFFFENNGFETFVKHTATRDKLIRIILQNKNVIDRLKQRYEKLPQVYSGYTSPQEVYSEIKEKRLEQMRKRSAINGFLNKFNSNRRPYLEFVGEALDYNEDNRLLRSISFYYVMNDKSIPKKFYQLLEARKNGSN